MAHYDTIIRGGMIVDGQRNSRFVGDVGIRDGIIAKVGRITPDATCDRQVSLTCTRTTTRKCSGTPTSPHRAGTASPRW
jgi:urease alpha subunit